MLSKAERRRSVRTVCSGTVRLTRFHWQRGFTGDLVDFSEDGLGFVSTFELKPGSTLLVHIEHVPSGGRSASPAGGPARSMGVVEVKWCRASEDRRSSLYAVGASYLLL